MLAHDCTLLEIGINFDRLYAGSDPDYEFALSVVRDRVSETHRVEQAKIEARRA
jgi:hypothetical protein